MSPSTYQEWLEVANERAADAQAMLKDRKIPGSVLKLDIRLYWKQ